MERIVPVNIYSSKIDLCSFNINLLSDDHHNTPVEQLFNYLLVP